MPEMWGSDQNSDFHFVERDESEEIVVTLVVEQQNLVEPNVLLSLTLPEQSSPSRD